LCHLHDTTWSDQRRAGMDFEQFMAEARPLRSFGACRAASCYLAAAHRKSRLCDLHDRMWRVESRRPGADFEAWAAAVRQPANGLVLSLRGLPELVRLELLYAIGCRVKEQVRTAPHNMRRYVDALRASGVGSVLEFDPAGLDPTGNRELGRFARFSVDRIRLAYADVDTERGREVWDLRLFGRSGRLDFSRIHQDWLREATKAWAAAALAQRDHQTIRHRVQSVGAVPCAGRWSRGRPRPRRVGARRHRPVPGAGTLGRLAVHWPAPQPSAGGWHRRGLRVRAPRSPGHGAVGKPGPDLRHPPGRRWPQRR